MSRLDHRPTDERVRAARAIAYPDQGDVIDALCEGIEALAGSRPLSAKTLAVLAERRAVKARYPKS
ncbi:hypothetical protein FBZ89_10683 [Nitrospirillum amazonense]|uniref:Uncharacterized protein n=1 Tax=Nitrospirillum amazonense TaxID=28077 RepID=A0A560FGF9_9PROT|nr:hypothetical protein [Nitrospirillum amazonense]TWB20684.1 hypothetical protein FBZ89_10683 [Nitrospirillum amazonense]